MKYDRCPNCMQALTEDVASCPYCEFEIANYKERPTCLRPFTVLQNKYMIGRVIGVGGFGITYIGWDMNLQTYIAIKEYYPESFVTRNTQTENASNQVVAKEANKEDYEKGLKRYVEEAQNLSRFYTLPGIVSVKDFFYENGTAYIVMEYINGINLKEYLNNAGGKLPEATVLSLMKPVFESLFIVHNGGLVHRDISPDNIMVTTEGKIKVIDFGAARENNGSADKTFTVILKHGYAPPEQYYAKGNQGPWTDIYSLCAAMYKMLTGEVPPNSIERMENDEYVAPSAHGVTVSPRTEYVLQRGLAVKTSDRYQNIGQLISDLYGSEPITPVPNQPTPVASLATNNVTQQSMYLSEPVEKKSKKGLVIGIICGVVAVAILAVVLILVNGKKDKDKDTTETTETTTEASTATSTDATTENPGPDVPVVPEVIWQWPTELSDRWQDYTFAVNDTVYALPMPYKEFMSKGWVSDSIPQSIPAGGMDYFTVSLNGLEAYVAICNYSVSAASIEECYLIGFSIDSSINNVPAGTIYEIAGGVRLGESDVQQVKSALGAPDSFYEGDAESYPDGYVSLDYAGDTWEDGMDLVLEGGVLTSISIANTAVPEGFELDPAQLETAPPEINSKYVAPTSGSTDRFDSIITVGEKHYKLPAPVTEFTEDGWTLDSATDDYIAGNSSIETCLQKNGSKIEVTIVNFTDNAILPVNGFVREIKVEAGYCDIEVIFPGDLRLSDPGSKFADVYSDMGDDYSRDDSWTAYIFYDVYYAGDSQFGYTVYAEALSDMETDIINQISYEDMTQYY